MKRKPLVLTEDQIDGKDPADAAWQVLLVHIKEMEEDEVTEYVRNLPQHWRAVFTGFEFLTKR